MEILKVLHGRGIPKIIRTPPTPSDGDVASPRNFSPTVEPIFERAPVEIHSIHGLSLTIRQFEPPKRSAHRGSCRKIVMETGPGQETLNIQQESIYPELYQDLLKRALVLATCERQITGSDIVGVIHMDLAGQDYPIVEENWEQLKGWFTRPCATFRFEFHVLPVPDANQPGSVKKTWKFITSSVREMVDLIVGVFQSK